MSYERALIAFNLRRWSLAKKLLFDELAREPNSSEAMTLLATCDYNSGDNNAAIEHSRAAIALDTKAHYAFYILGLALRATKQPFEAEIAIEEAITIEPTNATYLSALASMQFPRSKKRLELIDRALSCDPNHLWSLYQRYEILRDTRRNDEAEIVRQHVLRLNPEDAQMHAWSGWQALADSRGQVDALEHFEQALRIDPLQHKSVDGLREAQYQLKHPVLTRLKRFNWDMLTWPAVIIFVIGVILAVFGQHSSLDVPGNGFWMIFLIALGWWALFASIGTLVSATYYIGFRLSLHRSLKKSEIPDTGSPGDWKGLLYGIVFGVILIATDIALKSDQIPVFLPGWLYSDWRQMAGSSVLGGLIVILAPFVFVAAVGTLFYSVVSLIRWKMKGSQLSTRFFNMCLIAFDSVLVLLIYALVAFTGPTGWMIFVVVAMELVILAIPLSPFYREFVKRKLREQK